MEARFLLIKNACVHEKNDNTGSFTGSPPPPLVAKNIDFHFHCRFLQLREQMCICKKCLQNYGYATPHRDRAL